jgi:hypothetical protein
MSLDAWSSSLGLQCLGDKPGVQLPLSRDTEETQ